MQTCRKNNCTKEAGKKLGLCKYHYGQRNHIYKYLGYMDEVVNTEKIRICLNCDKSFLSTGNRRCNQCNSTSNCHHDNDVTLYVRC